MTPFSSAHHPQRPPTRNPPRAQAYIAAAPHDGVVHSLGFSLVHHAFRIPQLQSACFRLYQLFSREDVNHWSIAVANQAGATT